MQKIQPKKSLGQNFLTDKNIINRLSDLIGKEEIVLEIGAGQGAVTFELAKNVGRLYAIELDKRCLEFLEHEIKKRDIHNIFLINADILDFDLDSLNEKNIVVLGNLPYYIINPICMKLLENYKKIKRAIIMVQKEVADRWTAKPGSKIYGKTSVFVNMYCDIKNMFTVKPSCFYPAPKVSSAVVEMKFYNEPKYKLNDEELFNKIVKACFGKRRKQIVNSLQDLGIGRQEVLDTLKKAGLDENLRAEDLSGEDYAALSMFF